MDSQDTWTAQDRQGDILRELRGILAELSDLGDTAAGAAGAGNIEGLCEAAELLLRAHVRFAERYRTLLVMRPQLAMRRPSAPEPRSP